MKNTSFLLFYVLCTLSSCYYNKDGDDGPVISISNLRVNHYQNTTISSSFTIGDPGVEITVQEGSDIGSDREFQAYPYPIEGFEFQQGLIQDIKVKVTDLENPRADGSSTIATVIEFISKTSVSPETTFNIRLTQKENTDTFVNWVHNDTSTFSIINSTISIDCNSLCNELVTKIENQEQVTGVFTHGEENTYILQELITK